MGPRYAAPPRGPDTAPQPKAVAVIGNVKIALSQMMVRRFTARVPMNQARIMG